MGKSKAQTTQEAEQAFSDHKSILVAEDNPTNQDVIRRQLERLGYECDIASNAKQALEMWRAGTYGLLLTDLRMPGMDGRELTAALRKEEEAGDRRTTIIAVTANASQDEAQKCLDAGMDGYLTKPLGMKALGEMLEQWRGEKPGAPTTSAKPLPAGSAESPPAIGAAEDVAPGTDNNKAIDEAALKEVFGDDPETFKEILNDFIEPARENIEEIRAGAVQRAAGAVEAAAHKLKSSARSVGANRLADAAVILESAGKANDWSVIEEKSAELPALMEAVEGFVKEL